MTKVLSFKGNTSQYKKFVFPKEGNTPNPEEAIEVTMNFHTKDFHVQAVKWIDYCKNELWEPYGDSTFPSELFRDFLHSI